MSRSRLWPERADLEAAFSEAERAQAGEVQALTEYRSRPIDFIVEKLGARRETIMWSLNDGYERHEWDGTPDPLVKIADALAAHQNVGCEAGVGVGKTWLAAALVLHWLATREDSIVVTSAPKEAQLTGRLWKEIEALWPAFARHFPQATLMASGEIRMRPGTSRNWRAVAEVVGVEAGAQVAVKAQGWHARDLLIVVEEAAGAHPAAMAAYENTIVGPRNCMLAIGNPDHHEDPLRKFCELPDVEHVRISALDHPNYVLEDPTFIDGAASRRSVARLEARYAWSKAMRDSRIRGISPPQSADAALREFDAARHLYDDDISGEIGSGAWPVFVGLDGGRNWAAVLGAVDTEGRMHVAGEAFSRDASVSARVDAFVAMLETAGVTADTRFRAWYDNHDQVERGEFNRELKRRGLPWKVGLATKAPVRLAEGTDIPYRVGFVAKANSLLHRDALLFARDLDAGDWTWGADAASDGEPRTGSRLLAEVRTWAYGDPKAGRRSDNPDDRTADGAHAIAALRYALMPWVKQRARTPEERAQRARRGAQRARELARPVPMPRTPRDFYPQDSRNRDRGLERIAAHKWRTTGRYYDRFAEKRAREIEAARAERKAREEKERAERDAEHAAEKAKEAALSDVLDPLMHAIDESGLTEDEAIARLLGLDGDDRGD